MDIYACTKPFGHRRMLKFENFDGSYASFDADLLPKYCQELHKYQKNQKFLEKKLIFRKITLINVIQIDLKYCELFSLENICLDSFPSLRILVLEENNLTCFTALRKINFKYLQCLSIRRNRNIQSIDFSQSHLPCLEKLKMSGCRYRFPYEICKPYLPLLNRVAIITINGQNPYYCKIVRKLDQQKYCRSFPIEIKKN